MMLLLGASKAVERFMSKVSLPDDLRQCWEWTAGETHDGYGRFKIAKRTVIAHRWLYQQATNSILPEEVFVCHRCDNPACVNPSHLFPGTQQQNVDDMFEKGRGRRARGERHGAARLTDRQVEEIRKLCQAGQYTQPEIAAQYGVCRETVNHINRHKGRFS